MPDHDMDTVVNTAPREDVDDLIFADEEYEISAR